MGSHGRLQGLCASDNAHSPSLYCQNISCHSRGRCRFSLARPSLANPWPIANFIIQVCNLVAGECFLSLLTKMYPKMYKKCKKVFKNVLKNVQNCRKTCKNVKKRTKCTVNILLSWWNKWQKVPRFREGLKKK